MRWQATILRDSLVAQDIFEEPKVPFLYMQAQSPEGSHQLRDIGIGREVEANQIETEAVLKREQTLIVRRPQFERSAEIPTALTR